MQYLRTFEFIKVSTFFLTLGIAAGQVGVVHGQMETSEGILYGNEWINYNQTYFKVKVAQDGIYRIDAGTLTAAGIPSSVRGDQLQLFWMGKEQRLHTSTSAVFGDSDYLEFYGRQNRSELDRFLWEDPDNQMLNPEYSLYTDTSVYFLTWNAGGGNLRYQPAGAANPDQASRTTNRHTERIVLTNRLQKPALNSQGVRFSTYEEGEGYGTTLAATHTIRVPATGIVVGQNPPTVNFRLSGNSQNHSVSITWNGSPLGELSFAGSRLIDSTYTIEYTELQENNTLKFTTAGGSDRIVISNVALQYDREISQVESFGLFEFDGTESGLTISAAGLPAPGELIAYDITDGHILSSSAGSLAAPAGSAIRAIAIASLSEVHTPTLHPTDWEDLRSSAANYIMVTAQKLLGESGSNPVQEYEDYRSSEIGGSYDVQTVLIDQLIDQFSYGVAMHPLAVKNFVNFIAQNWSDPQFIFLIGRGYHYNLVRTTLRNNHLIPPYGLPGSDNIISSAGNTSVPLVPIGRLAASTPDDVRIYLDKIKVMEEQMTNAPQTIEDRAWMKRVLHLSAGASGGNERLILENSLKSMGKILEENKFGAEITSFSKHSQDLASGQTNENLIKLIEDGIILKTYFGHGGINITELDNFEQPENFNNENRYSCMVSLGCHTGDMYTSVISLSEENVLAEKRGAIAYVATSGLGFLSSLDQFGDQWYAHLGGDFYGATIGESIQATVQQMSASNSIGIKTLVQQLTLHGDPAFRLSRVGQAPDFTFDLSTARTEPASISSSIESFDFLVDVVNLGRTQKDSIAINFTRILPDGRVGQEKEVKVQLDRFAVEVRVPMTNEFQGISGRNFISAEIDPLQESAEGPLPEALRNNTLGVGDESFSFFIRDNAVLPVQPCNFGIVGKPGPITLTASTTDAFAASQNYLFELDTNLSFSSPSLLTGEIQNAGGPIEWQPSFNFQAREEYYWRVSPEPSDSQALLWNNSSFTYDPNSSSGWRQGHYQQYQQNVLNGLNPTEGSNMYFDSAGVFYSINNGVWGTGVGVQFNFETFAISMRPWLVINGGVAVIMVDPKSGQTIINSGGDFGSVNTSSFASHRVFVFPTSTVAERNTVIRMLTNEVPDDFYVYFLTVLRRATSEFYPEQWADSLNGASSIFDILEGEGATQVRSLSETGSVPYTFAYQKGRGPIAEILATSRDDLISMTSLVPTPGSEGRMITRPIGPALKWDHFSWNIDAVGSDSLDLLLTTLDDNFEAVQTFSIEEAGQLDLSSVDAALEPYIRIELFTSDEANQSPPKLTDWQLIYNEYPDLAIGSVANVDYSLDTFNRGEIIELPFSITNLTNVNFDSVDIEYSLIDVRNNVIINRDKTKPLQANEQLQTTYSFETDHLLGQYRLNISVNNQIQKEKNYLNNIGVYEFFIRGENISPILDIFFDGNRIQEGDIVAPEPSIDISLNDENSNQLIDDVELFKLRLVYPTGQSEVIDPSNDQRVQFLAASSEDNVAHIIFSPKFDQDGVYRLFVQGSDKLNNPAGEYEQSIGFEVILQSTISRIYNYPNPFSSSTQFVFNLTGEIPQQLNIQILEPSGKVVRTITAAELGPLRIGLNRSSFKWDGTDDYGDKLANGIYLFKVHASDGNRENIELRSSAADDLFFEKNLGKIVILR